MYSINRCEGETALVAGLLVSESTCTYASGNPCTSCPVAIMRVFRRALNNPPARKGKVCSSTLHVQRLGRSYTEAAEMEFDLLENS